MSLAALIEKQKARQAAKIRAAYSDILGDDQIQVTIDWWNGELDTFGREIAETLYREIRPEDKPEFTQIHLFEQGFNKALSELDRRFKSYCEKV